MMKVLSKATATTMGTPKSNCSIAVDEKQLQNLCTDIKRFGRGRMARA